ncbi:hypothetical protein RND71_026861 [Anisodus tanguticus]|uniref:Aquaporin n=1 Tax=Anisodus tanguticus TaxID=243964 RepID=A0AAE1V443_9SOLA|nr:hypothetical protein RND71_026861 [Anisodus tanguticus]
MEEGKYGTVQTPMKEFASRGANKLVVALVVVEVCDIVVAVVDILEVVVGILGVVHEKVVVPIYVLPQFLGSTLACLTLRVLFNHQDDILPMLTQYKISVTDFEAIFWEFLMNLILMFVICGAATDDRANKELAGVAIGVTLVFEVLIAGPITGASMNPTRSLGPAIVSGVYKNQWVFVIAPILGAMTATGIYSLLRQPK